MPLSIFELFEIQSCLFWSVCNQIPEWCIRDHCSTHQRCINVSRNMWIITKKNYQHKTDSLDMYDLDLRLTLSRYVRILSESCMWKDVCKYVSGARGIGPQKPLPWILRSKLENKDINAKCVGLVKLTLMRCDPCAVIPVQSLWVDHLRCQVVTSGLIFKEYSFTGNQEHWQSRKNTMWVSDAS